MYFLLFIFFGHRVAEILQIKWTKENISGPPEINDEHFSGPFCSLFMESAGQYLQWHPTSRVGLYSYSRLWSLWDSVLGVCSVPMGLTGHLAWEDRKEQHENILPLRPPWSSAILSSCLPELNHSSACVHLWEEDIKRDRGFVRVTPQT